MEDNKLYYRAGFLYQVYKTIQFQTDIEIETSVAIDFATLHANGLLTVFLGYAWDGPSGPTKWINKCLPGQWLKDKWLKTIMKGSLPHDVLYEMMRKGKLDIKWRPHVDAEMLRVCKEDGMSRPRLWRVRVGLEKFAKFAALPENKKDILTAP